jgi:hypothetical protein
MRRLIAALLLAACLGTTNVTAARAGEGDFLGISKEQALVVGAGVVGGALVVHLVAPGDFTFFAGGVLGGLAALWWYENGGESRLRPLLRLDSAGAVAAGRGRSALEGLALGH